MVDYKFYSICFLFLLCYHLEIHKEIRTFSFSVEFLGTLWLLYTSNFSIYFPRTVAFITNNTHIPCLEHLQANKKKYIMIDALTALTNLGYVKKNNALLQWEGISSRGCFMEKSNEATPHEPTTGFNSTSLLQSQGNHSLCKSVCPLSKDAAPSQAWPQMVHAVHTRAHSRGLSVKQVEYLSPIWIILFRVHLRKSVWSKTDLNVLHCLGQSIL